MMYIWLKYILVPTLHAQVFAELSLNFWFTWDKLVFNGCLRQRTTYWTIRKALVEDIQCLSSDQSSSDPPFYLVEYKLVEMWRSMKRQVSFCMRVFCVESTSQQRYEPLGSAHPVASWSSTSSACALLACSGCRQWTLYSMINQCFLLNPRDLSGDKILILRHNESPGGTIYRKGLTNLPKVGDSGEVPLSLLRPKFNRKHW